jgi:hypothetical protein
MATKIETLRILEGGLLDAPVWSAQKRARNWCATVRADPTAPGGMQRRFWNHGRGDIFRYIVATDLITLDVVEFGADQIAWSGNRHPDRFYGVVVELTKDKLVLAECPSASVAFVLAEDLRAQAREGQAIVRVEGSTTNDAS